MTCIPPRRRHRWLVSLLLPGLTAAACADEPLDWDLKGQVTYVGQRKSAFTSPYQGRNSLTPDREISYSLSATAYGIVRVPVLGDLVINPELIQGRALSGLVGLGSFSNGEMQKVAGSDPKVYLSRLFLRRDWALGTDTDTLPAAPNQLAGLQASDRVRLTVGKFAVTDVFDANSVSHDARTQFLSWASLAHGSFDYAADAQGYTVGAALELTRGPWTLRAGRFKVPQESNGQALDPALMRHHGDQLEVEHLHSLGGRPGAVRVLLWRNRARMGAFQDALNAAGTGAPSVDGVRRTQVKSGVGLHGEQALSDDLTAFARWSRSDGRTETYSFEEVDGSAQLGLNLNGSAWGRPQDTLGLLAIRNSLSDPHRRYLAQGGYGFFIGDGRLNYAPEQLIEAYYRWSVARATALSLDLQRIHHPAYNADRGPVTIVTVRAHTEF